MMKIWAHRGCSQRYPENTITSFEKAVSIPGLEGIELDIQLTRDGEMVVIHDERVDRTTDGTGFVRDFSLAEIKALNIDTDSGVYEHIPTIKEVLDLVKDHSCRINIELKNGKYPYPGMEDMIVDLVHKYGLNERVLYSSFNADSLEKLAVIETVAPIGMLAGNISDCLKKAIRLEQVSGRKNIALHPKGTAIDITPDNFSGRSVRAWFSGHLFPEKPTGGRMDLGELEAAGVTDVFLNEPEIYC